MSLGTFKKISLLKDPREKCGSRGVDKALAWDYPTVLNSRRSRNLQDMIPEVKEALFAGKLSTFLSLFSSCLPVLSIALNRSVASISALST